MALGLGSNLGDSLGHLRAAVHQLGALGLHRIIVSSVYESAPVGYEDQPDFLNAAVIGRWKGSPRPLLEAALAVERTAGRERSFRNAPRPLDIDVLLFGSLVVAEPGLVVPHPRWKERSFVLAPLCEVVPTWRDPVSGETVEDIWSRLRGDLPEAHVVAAPSALRSASS